MPGKGKLILTGKLGEVMQESAQAALSYVRSRAERFGIDKKFIDNLDIHVHVAEGAVPKDGPSAGVTMATAMISALAKVPVRRDVAMTGEITLRGRVLPIGGLKEKALAAHRGGIRTILIPRENVKDVREIPRRIRKEMTIIPVDHVDEVLRAALVLENPDTFFRKELPAATVETPSIPSSADHRQPDGREGAVLKQVLGRPSQDQERRLGRARPAQLRAAPSLPLRPPVS